MAELKTGKKSKFAIGTQAENPLTDTYTNVGKIESIGEFGPEKAVATFLDMSSGVTDKAEGGIDYGQLQVSLGYLANDAGHDKLRDADAAGGQWNFRITLDDAPRDHDGAIVGTPSIWFCRGIITSLRVNIQGRDNVVTSPVRIELVHVQRVAAAVASS